MMMDPLARFFGTPVFLVAQTVIVGVWICLNTFSVPWAPGRMPGPQWRGQPSVGAVKFACQVCLAGGRGLTRLGAMTKHFTTALLAAGLSFAAATAEDKPQNSVFDLVFDNGASKSDSLRDMAIANIRLPELGIELSGNWR